MHTLILSLLTAATLHPAVAPRAAGPVKIVTSLTTYGSIAKEVGGDRATVTSIAQGDEDPHFVQPRPSFVPLLRDADLFVWTGMDLELWVGTLLDRAGNPKIRDVASSTELATDSVTNHTNPTARPKTQVDPHTVGIA